MIDWETFKSQMQTDPGRMLKSVLLLAGCLFMIWLIVVMQSNPGMQQNVQVQNSGRLDSLRIVKMQSESGNGLSDAQKQPANSPGIVQKQTGETPGDAKVPSEDSTGVAENKSANNMSVAKSHSGDGPGKAGSNSAESPGIAETQSGDSIKKAKTQSADSLGAAGTKSRESPALFRHARADRESAGALSDRDNGFTGVFPTVLILLVLIGGAWYWLRTQRKSGNKQGAGPLFTTVASQQLPGGPKFTVIKLNGEYWVMASSGPQGTQLMHRYTSEEWKGLEEIGKQQETRDWKNTFLQTLNSSSYYSDDAKQKRTG